MKRIWDVFPKTAARVWESHEDVDLHGHHDWVHALRVGEIARQVALEEWGDERISHLAGLAGLCHNADRVLAHGGRLSSRTAVSCGEVDYLVEYWVGEAIRLNDVRQIVNAVLRHSAKNSPNDSKVLIALMDGDRVVNLDTDLFPRSGQYYHDLPVVDYRYFLEDPEATYRSPKSVLRDIAYSMDWADPTSAVSVRTQLGRKMAGDRVKVFQTFFDALKAQLAEEGIHPYPF